MGIEEAVVKIALHRIARLSSFEQITGETSIMLCRYLR